MDWNLKKRWKVEVKAKAKVKVAPSHFPSPLWGEGGGEGEIRYVEDRGK